jgi:hypothetical protein
MTLDEIISQHTDSSGKWVAFDDVKTIIETYLRLKEENESMGADHHNQRYDH